MIKKNPKADLCSYYTVLFQFGIICSLLFMIAATRMNFEEKIITDDNQKIEPDFKPIILPPILPPDTPPAPLRPTVFNIIPPENPMEPDIIDFGPIKFDESIPLPPLTPPVEPAIRSIVEVMPIMKGGNGKLYSEIKYPKQAQDINVEGRVVVQYIVNEKGNVENPEIIRGIGGGCDEEVLRAIKLMSFTPGIQNGRFVKVKIKQIVTFKLQN
tara:strand:+ start:23053 stop:23691 length:639 start_codon:yes stop_codon:yes gene_type:complete